jgi:large subunit ribosomal protein L28
LQLFKKNDKEVIMSNFCELTGKGPMFGHYVSHSNRKTKRKFLPNLRTKKFFIPELDEWITLKVSTSAIRTIAKKGIYAYLKDLNKKGDIVLK